MTTRTALAVFLGFAISAAATPLLSAVLIEVDVTNPAAVTLTATGNASQVNDSSATLYDGVTLVQFFTVPFPGYQDFALSGNLTAPSGHGLSYNHSVDDDYPLALTGLNLFYSGTYQTDVQSFSTAAPAFTGVAVASLSAFVARLPAAGASGNIIAGYNYGGSEAVLGQWAVVPEPSMLVLGGIGAAACLLRRRNSIG